MNKLMNENHQLLEKRIIDALKTSDLESIYQQLDKINNNTLITGVGGSFAVCKMAAKVLEKTNSCNCKICDPINIKWLDQKKYSNILAISFSGNNYGVKLSLNTKLNKYLLTNNKTIKNSINLIWYNMNKEKSFISLASTLIPITILFNYYLQQDIAFYHNIFQKYEKNNYILPEQKNITILYGDESETAATFLNTSLVEAGIARPLMTTKYNYCHGFTTLDYQQNNSDLILFKSIDQKLDSVIINEVKSIYKNIVIISNHIKDPILADYDFLIQCYYLLHQIAVKYHKDLAVVKYAPAVKTLYYFKGGE